MEPITGQIVLFAGHFEPRGWAFCNGQLLKISDHTALFALLGNTYGGDGNTTFALPDLRGRVPVHAGQSPGPGLQNYPEGKTGGREEQTLTIGQLPAHQHGFKQPCANTTPQNETDNPENKVSAPATTDIFGDPTPNTFMKPGITDPTGNGQPVSILQPFLALNFIIALYGIFPGRN